MVATMPLILLSMLRIVCEPYFQQYLLMSLRLHFSSENLMIRSSMCMGRMD